MHHYKLNDVFNYSYLSVSNSTESTILKLGLRNITSATGFAAIIWKMLAVARLNVRLEHARRQLNHLTAVDEVLLKVAQPVVYSQIHQYLSKWTDARPR